MSQRCHRGVTAVSHGVTACHACRGGVTACHGVSRCHHGVTRCHGRVAWCHGGVTRCHAGVTAVSTWCHGRVTVCHAGVASMSRGVTAVSPGVTRCPEVSTLDQHVDMLTSTGDAGVSFWALSTRRLHTLLALVLALAVAPSTVRYVSLSRVRFVSASNVRRFPLPPSLACQTAKYLFSDFLSPAKC